MTRFRSTRGSRRADSGASVASAASTGGAHDRQHAPGVLLFAMAWWGFCAGVNGAIAPALARDFDLDETELALLFGGLGLSALVALVLGRSADRVGRARLLRWSLMLAPASAVVSALSPGPLCYAASQLAVYGFGTTVFMLVTVMISELPGASRTARRQARAGLVFTIATAVPMALMAVAGVGSAGWRWIWALAALPLLAWPALRRSLEPPRDRGAPEPGRPPAGSTPGATGPGGLFEGRRGPIAWKILVCAALVSSLEMSCRFWLFHHAVAGLGAAPGEAVLVLVAGGAIGLLGFPIGARCAMRFGLGHTVMASSTVFVLGVGLYYGAEGSAAPFDVISMSARFGLLALGGNACLVSFRTLAMELIEPRWRGSLAGWIAMANAVGWWAILWGMAPLIGVLGTAGSAIVVLAGAALPLLWLCLSRLPEPARATGRALGPTEEAAAVSLAGGDPAPPAQPIRA